MKGLLIVIILPLFMAACSRAPNQEETDVPALEGPALVMWYTDN